MFVLCLNFSYKIRRCFEGPSFIVRFYDPFRNYNLVASVSKCKKEDRSSLTFQPPMKPLLEPKPPSLDAFSFRRIIADVIEETSLLVHQRAYLRDDHQDPFRNFVKRGVNW